jgi:predicted GNAT family acetyltransferase
VDRELIDDTARERFELQVNGRPAGFIEYHRYGNEIALLHTEVNPEFRGQGIGGALVEGVLVQVRDQGLALLPYCGFVRGWIDEHPDYRDLVPEDQRRRFRL